MAERRVVPRTFFLNETHEHARDDRDGGGRVPAFTNINWTTKGRGIAKSLRAARETVARTPDPLKDKRLFLLSRPEPKLEKVSSAKKAKGGVLETRTTFAGQQSRVFERLGLDLLRVTPQGNAIVHASLATVEQLESTAQQLGSAGRKEQARWAFLADFNPVPLDARVDTSWLASLNESTGHDVIIELQPVLSREEFDAVFGAIRDVLAAASDRQPGAGGRDLSGRRWLRGHLRPATIRVLATEFQSIQSIHAPLRSVAFSGPGDGGTVHPAAAQAPRPGQDLPAVAIVDAGVPRDHLLLAPYRRGEYRHAEAVQTNPGDHGSRVASRVVFGEVDAGRPAFAPPAGECQFLDVVVPVFSDENGEPEFDDKSIFEALRDVARAYPDVRVFNLSLGSYVPLSKLDAISRAERLAQLQDLDNFAFDHDVAVVVSAGNTPPGMVPNRAYPAHADEPDWGLGAWAAGFNTVVVGGYVAEPNTDGVGRRVGWPSPFSRVGPGMARAPVPNYSAGGGDCTPDYHWRQGVGLGVWTLSQRGDWEDAPGTSYSAPIVARETALTIRELQRHCGPGVLPFAATVKAFMALVARHQVGHHGVAKELAARTLGRGRPSRDRLVAATPESAVFVWQGTLERAGHIARVRLPVPREWLREAKSPRLRMICAWNTPTFAGAPDVWACRRVSLQLRPALGGQALRGRGAAVGAYPLIDRIYDLSAAHLKELEITQ